MESRSANKAVLITDSVVPASPLDNVLKFREFSDIEVTLYDFINGEILDSSNRKEFYQTIVHNAINRIYPTTDHLITCVNIDDINFLYVSLDNSVRSNMNNHPLYLRLDKLCEVLDKIIRSLDNKCIVFFFFQESLQPIFSWWNE